MTTLVTGAAGFTGRHLVPLLRERGPVVAIGAPAAGIAADVWVEVDLAIAGALDQVLREWRPACIVHLAGRTHAAAASDLYMANVGLTVNLFESVRRAGLRTRVINVGSSAQYASAAACPITEEAPIGPTSHYGASKAAQELVARQYGADEGVTVIATRTFNLVGPGQPDSLACSAFARQIVEIEAGLRAPLLEVGRLDACRDFVDVRDAARAYAVLCDASDAAETVNVCSGRAVAMRDCLDILRSETSATFEVEATAARLRQDVPFQLGSHDTLTAATGWMPLITLERSLRDLLEYWRDVIGRGARVREH